MQLIVNGNQTHVLDVSPEADVACLRAQLSMREGVDCEQVYKSSYYHGFWKIIKRFQVEPLLLWRPTRGRREPGCVGEPHH